MTRENKLAMVVGFGLLLFVGILVSDHFSTAQRQENANLVTADRTRDRVSRPISIAAVPAANTPALQQAEVMSPAPSNGVRQTSGEGPVAGDGKAPKSDVRPISNLPNATAGPVIGAADKAKPAKVQESEPGVQLHPIAEGETLFSICAKTYGDGTLWKELAEYNKKAVPNPAQLRKGVTLRLPPVEQLRHGGAVASTNKGARVNAAPSAQESNALRLNSTGGSKANQEVPLLAAADVAGVEPSPAVIESKSSVIDSGSGVVEVLPKSSVKSGAKSAAPKTAEKPADGKAANPAAGGEVYVVQKGDTLASIAKKKLGKNGKWQDIAAANGSSLSDPAALSPGMTIKLPKTN